MENYINIINDNIEKYCRDKKIKLTDLSTELGFSSSYYYAIRRNGGTFPLKDLQRVAEKLGIDFIDLVSKENAIMSKEIVMIPLISQKLSAGYGEPGIDSEISIISIPKYILKNNNPNNIYAAKVKGDSMIGANLYEGDVVCFRKDYIEGDGIYVIYYMNDYFVKRLQFNPFENKVNIISENPKYKNFEIDASNENLIIKGKVIGWVHAE